VNEIVEEKRLTMNQLQIEHKPSQETNASENMFFQVRSNRGDSKRALRDSLSFSIRIRRSRKKLFLS
jgi:hypothetical protein